MGRAQAFLRQHQTAVNRMVDIENERVTSSRDWLNRFAPMTSYVDYDLLLLKARKNRAMAHFVGFAGEIPESKGGELREAEFSPVKIGCSTVMDEDDMNESGMEIAIRSKESAQKMSFTNIGSETGKKIVTDMLKWTRQKDRITMKYKTKQKLLK